MREGTREVKGKDEELACDEKKQLRNQFVGRLDLTPRIAF